MYPYFSLFGFKFYMTGFGIIISTISFIFFIWYFGKKYGLNFWKFFNYIPLLLVLPYFYGSYIYFIFESKKFFNLNFFMIVFGIFLVILFLFFIFKFIFKKFSKLKQKNQSINISYIFLFIVLISLLPLFVVSVLDPKTLYSILSPYGYKINFIGISFGLFLFLFIFLNTLKVDIEIDKWIDVFYYSISLCLIPLGVMLLLGDNFIGNPTNSIIGVSSFIEDSVLFKYNKVYPIGLFLSLIGIFSFIVIFILNFINRRVGLGIYGFILILILINVVFLYQNYSRHIVLNINNFIFDIKNYWTIVLIVLIIILYGFLKKKVKNENKIL